MISERIGLLRNQMGLTQTDLAKKLNITRASLNAWEMGVSIPSTQYIIELANLFKVSTDYLFGIDPANTINIDSLNEKEKTIIFDLMHYFNSNK